MNTISIPKETISEAERGGLIQFFELSFELSWKVLKDYLEEEMGYQVKGPKDALKLAFQVGLVVDGHAWMKALDDQNLTTHTYDSATSLKVETLIRIRYFPIISDLYHTLKAK